MAFKLSEDIQYDKSAIKKDELCRIYFLSSANQGKLFPKIKWEIFDENYDYSAISFYTLK
jgi:hypothetical protein